MNTKQHFESFDALRFISFLIVFFSHLPYSKFNSLQFLHLKGTIGVNFFFILSGFLITYILLFEKKQNGSINLKQFFIKRTLRIWPLYFAILLFAFLSSYIIKIINLPSSDTGYEPNWIMSCLFLENYMIIYHNDFANVSPLPGNWSLCIEEHFYILWGILLYYTRTTRVLFTIISLIAVGYLSRFLFNYNNWLFKDLFTNFDYFMYGAIPAYLYVNNAKKFNDYILAIPKTIKSLVIILSILLIFVASHYGFEYSQLIEPIAYGILFTSVLIIFIPLNNDFKISSRFVFSKLGKYTYSLYLTHIIVINFYIQLFVKANWNFEKNSFLFIIAALLTTILVSYSTYRIIELPFLKLKSYFK
jgi:peptidoglycan/LPS O-acetylase OafA/YrhL